MDANTIQQLDEAAAQVQRVLTALHELRSIVVNAPDEIGATAFDQDLEAAASGVGAHLDEGKAKFVELSQSHEQLLALAESAKSDINASSRGQQIIDGIKTVLGMVESVIVKVAPAILG